MMDIKNIFPLQFEKMSGAGNDFIIIDHRQQPIPREYQAEFARKVCRRMFSVGADGLILLEEAENADFRWQFYNADGSEAEMCGNGARCVARFAYEHGIAGEKMSFQTLAGPIEAEIVAATSEVRVRMTEPFDYRVDLAISLDGEAREVFFVNTGVPHAVIFVDEEVVPVVTWGRKVRFHELFAPEGSNVNFVCFQDDGSLRVRTYERGVEEETMACGTGVVASAIAAACKKSRQSPLLVHTSGGDVLTVSFDWDPQAEKATQVYQQGPARRVFAGQLTIEALL